GAGGGGNGQQVPIVLPVGPGNQGGGTITLPPGVVPGNNTTPTTTAQQTGITANAPTVTTQRTDTDTTFTFTFNANAAQSLGTVAPTDFLIQSPEAINVPIRVRVYQNNRNAEAKGDIRATPISISSTEGLVDLVLDSARNRLYIANSGLNRVEVYDTLANA